VTCRIHHRITYGDSYRWIFRNWRISEFRIVVYIARGVVRYFDANNIDRRQIPRRSTMKPRPLEECSPWLRKEFCRWRKSICSACVFGKITAGWLRRRWRRHPYNFPTVTIFSVYFRIKIYVYYGIPSYIHVYPGRGTKQNTSLRRNMESSGYDIAHKCF